jgi:hypothetical protein
MRPVAGIGRQYEAGDLARPGFIPTPKNLALAERAMREAVQFINECFNLGLVRWIEEPEPRDGRKL